MSKFVGTYEDAIMMYEILIPSNSTKDSKPVIYSDIVLLTGVGYRVELREGNVLRLDVGYSRYVKVKLPSNVNVVVDPSGTRITLSSNDNVLRGDTLFKIVSIRPRNPYTGAGIVVMKNIDRLRKLKSTKAEKTK